MKIIICILASLATCFAGFHQDYNYNNAIEGSASSGSDENEQIITIIEEAADAADPGIQSHNSNFEGDPEEIQTLRILEETSNSFASGGSNAFTEALFPSQQSQSGYLPPATSSDDSLQQSDQASGYLPPVSNSIAQAPEPSQDYLAPLSESFGQSSGISEPGYTDSVAPSQTPEYLPPLQTQSQPHQYSDVSADSQVQHLQSSFPQSSEYFPPESIQPPIQSPPQVAPILPPPLPILQQQVPPAPQYLPPEQSHVAGSKSSPQALGSHHQLGLQTLRVIHELAAGTIDLPQHQSNHGNHGNQGNQGNIKTLRIIHQNADNHNPNSAHSNSGIKTLRIITEPQGQKNHHSGGNQHIKTLRIIKESRPSSHGHGSAAPVKTIQFLKQQPISHNQPYPASRGKTVKTLRIIRQSQPSNIRQSQSSSNRQPQPARQNRVRTVRVIKKSAAASQQPTQVESVPSKTLKVVRQTSNPVAQTNNGAKTIRIISEGPRGQVRTVKVIQD